MGIAFLKTSAFEGRKYISLALTHFQNDGYPIWKGARNAQVIYVVSYLTQVYLLLLYCRLTIMIIIIQKDRQSYSWKLLLLYRFFSQNFYFPSFLCLIRNRARCYLIIAFKTTSIIFLKIVVTIYIFFTECLLSFFPLSYKE